MSSFAGPQNSPTISTNSYATVSASIVDSHNSNYVKFLVQEANGAHGVTAILVGRMTTRGIDGSVESASPWVAIGSASVISAGSSAEFSSGISDAHYDQYAMQIKSTSTGMHGGVYVYGSASSVQQVPDMSATFEPLVNEFWVDSQFEGVSDGSISAPFALLGDAVDLLVAGEFSSNIIRVAFGNHTTEGTLSIPDGVNVTVIAHHACAANFEMAATGHLTIISTSVSLFGVSASAESTDIYVTLFGNPRAVLTCDDSAAPQSLGVRAHDSTVILLGSEVVFQARDCEFRCSGDSIFSDCVGCRFTTSNPVIGTTPIDFVPVFRDCEFSRSMQTFTDKLMLLGCTVELEASGFTFSGDGRLIGQQTLFVDAATLAALELSNVTFTNDFTIQVIDELPSALGSHDVFVDSNLTPYQLAAANGTQRFPFLSLQRAVTYLQALNVKTATIHASGTFDGSAVSGSAMGTPDAAVTSFSGALGVQPLAGSLIVTDGTTTWTDNGSGGLTAAGGDGANGYVNYNLGFFQIAWNGAGSPGDAVTADYSPVDSAVAITADDANYSIVGDFAHSNGTVTFSSGNTTAAPSLSIRGNNGSTTVGAIVLTNPDSCSLDLQDVTATSINCSGVTIGETVTFSARGVDCGAVSDRAAPDSVIAASGLYGSNFSGAFVAQNLGWPIESCSFVGMTVQEGTSPENVFSNCKLSGTCTFGEEASFDQATQMLSSNVAVVGTVRRGGLVWSRDALAPASTNSTQTPGSVYRRVFAYSATGAFDFTMPAASSYSIGEQIAVIETDNSFAITVVATGGDTFVGSVTVQGEMSVWTKIAATVWARGQ